MSGVEPEYETVGATGSNVDLTIVTMRFDGADVERLQGVLSKYTVLTRMEAGCRNIDLCASVTAPGTFLIVEKWSTPDDQRRHFDSAVMIEMAESCRGLLTKPPAIDLLESISAHDLR